MIIFATNILMSCDYEQMMIWTLSLNDNNWFM